MVRLLRSSVLRQCLFLAPAVVLLALPASGQDAPAAPPAAGAPAQGRPGGGPGGPRGPRVPYKPQNLKVLPEDTNLLRVMGEYAASLGVRCEYCHAAPDPTTHRSDRASDANPMKDQARVMIRMVQDLNQKYISQLAKPADGHERETITCGTCHRGEARPPVFVPPPPPGFNRAPGAPAAAPPATPPNPS